MGAKLETFCDGCKDAIKLEEPHLAVMCNLQRGVALEAAEAHLPLNQRGGIQTAEVVTLVFCSPQCAVTWFENEGEGGFKDLPSTEPARAEPGSVSDDVLTAVAAAEAMGGELPPYLADVELSDRQRGQVAARRERIARELGRE